MADVVKGVIFDIVAPLNAPQVLRPAPASPKPPRLDWIDQLLLDRLTDAGSCPTWTLLNAVEAEHPAQDRTRGRLFRLQLWDRLKRLRRMGLVFTQGRNRVSATKPDPARRPSVRRRRRTVGGWRSNRAVSAVTASAPKESGREANQVRAEVFVGTSDRPQTTLSVTETQSPPAPEVVSAAASALARLPRRPKRIWSGWINDSTRAYRNMAVVLPENRSAFVFGVLRGRLVYTFHPGVCAGDPDEAGRSWGVVRAGAVEIIRNPHAVLLGRLKAGAVERRSELKAASARVNGRLPAREGSRPRGRPPTTARL